MAVNLRISLRNSTRSVNYSRNQVKQITTWIFRFLCSLLTFCAGADYCAKPPTGERVGVRGFQPPRETSTPHPTPLPKGEGADRACGPVIGQKPHSSGQHRIGSPPGI